MPGTLTQAKYSALLRSAKRAVKLRVRRKLTSQQEEDLVSELLAQAFAAHPDPTTITDETFDALIDRVYRREVRSAEQEVGLSKPEDIEKLAGSSSEDVGRIVSEALGKEKVSRESALEDRLRRALESGDSVSKTQAMIYLLHAGRYVIPGQPKALTKQVRAPDNKLVPVSYAHMRAFHPRSSGKNCPTCAVIARFLVIPGVDSAGVGRVVDAYASKLFTQE